MASIFSRIVHGEIPCHKVAEDDRYLAFLDIHPLRKGHTLVIPKVEVDHLFDLDDELLSGMLPFAKEVARRIKSVVPCARIGVTVIGIKDVLTSEFSTLPSPSHVIKDSDLLVLIGKTDSVEKACQPH